MANEIKLPQLGQTMEEGTVVSCLVKVGDEVKKGDVIFEVETDKATLEMESPAEGFVKHIICEVGQTLEVNSLMMVLGGKDEQVAVPKKDSPTDKAQLSVATPAEAPVEAPVEPAAAEKTGRVFASPRAKAKAGQLGIELSSISGSGPGGRIVEADVVAATSAKKAEVEPVQPKYKLGQRVPLNRLGKIIAQRMLQSKREIPCFYLNVKVDATDMVRVRAELNKTGNVKVAFNDFIMRALAMGIRHYPIMTGQIDGDNIQLADSIGIGLAISVPGGLVAPIVKDVGSKTLTEIAACSKALIARAQNNKLSPDDLAGGCITLTNLGAMDIDSFIPIVVPGQCSILGVGKITDTCVPDSGGILVRKIMNMTLSVDHKVVNGAEAAQFLDFVAKLLTEPEKLI